jgi:hypothetical protein
MEEGIHAHTYQESESLPRDGTQLILLQVLTQK